MNKKILIGGLLCTIGLSSVFGFNTGFAFDFFSNATVDLPLQGIDFYRGGDMQGSTHGVSVKLLDNQSALVCYEDASWHNEAIAVKEYIVPASLLEDIKNIFNENKLIRCEKAPNSKEQVLDGATSSYGFYFEKKRIYFSSTQNLPNGSYDALRKIKNCVASACEKGQRLPGLVLEKDENGYMPMRRAIAKGSLAIKVVGYKDKALEISIGNGLETEQTVALKSKIMELKDSNVVVAENTTGDTVDVAKNYNYDYRWKLDKRLEAGRYSLDLGGYTTEFEIK